MALSLSLGVWNFLQFSLQQEVGKKDAKLLSICFTAIYAEAVDNHH